MHGIKNISKIRKNQEIKKVEELPPPKQEKGVKERENALYGNFPLGKRRLIKSSVEDHSNY